MRTSGSRLLIACFVLTAGMVRAAEEPTAQIASTWWPDLTNVVTPVAWRDHPHRFNVIYNGTILAIPNPQQVLRFDWSAGKPLEGLQLDFETSADGSVPPPATQPYWLALRGGKRVGDQGWDRDHGAPLLWTRWKSENGAELRQRVFAHMQSGGEPQSGDEPMFAWIRIEATGAPYGFAVSISAPHIRFEMSESDNCRVLPGAAAYPKALRLEKQFIVENENVRLAVIGGQNVSFEQSRLYVSLAAGQHADLLLPMLPTARAAIEHELALGFDAALVDADKFWSDQPPTAAKIHTPEPLINESIEDSVRIARMLSTTVPQTKQKSLLSGSLVYSYLWGTPTSMTSHMLLDPMGRHDDVAKYLEIYREDQGRTKAPGPDFKPHPGYFGPPRALDSGNQWLTDHGAILYAAARHALLTGDEQFIARWTDPIVKACDFIKDARQLPRPPPSAIGVLPPGSASDISKPIQAFWSDGWNYKGLVAAVRLLKTIHHPRAEEFDREAADYRDAIVRAMREKSAHQPKWTDPAGREHLIVPMTLTTDDNDGLSFQHPFYLDTGPTFGVWAGVFAADDPLMRDAIAFLRDGPQWRDTSADKRFIWRNSPRLIHEMSSAEPCYSWNVFHSWQLGDREHFLEGMYSLFTGALARTTHVSCETRGGITENVFASTLAVDLARLAVIDDEIEPGTLHLMRLTPLAWISKTEQTRFENVPSEFGPVTLRWQLSADGRTLNVEYKPDFRRPPGAILLHIPPVQGLETIVINGRERGLHGTTPIPLER
jgi:hypothetical protein